MLETSRVLRVPRLTTAILSAQPGRCFVCGWRRLRCRLRDAIHRLEVHADRGHRRVGSAQRKESIDYGFHCCHIALFRTVEPSLDAQNELPVRWAVSHCRRGQGHDGPKDGEWRRRERNV